MLKEALKKNKNDHRRIDFLIKLTIIYFIFLLTSLYSYSDAYLSEDRVYYGANSYTVDYEKEVIYANGNAYFKKGSKIVNANRITIYYSENAKKAYFFKDVIIKNFDDNSKITGKYAEAKFNEDYYIIEGKTLYTKDSLSISSKQIESKKNGTYNFSGDVIYNDESYEIKSQDLSIDRKVSEFKNSVVAIDINSKDTIFSDFMKQLSDSGNIEFHGRVLYLQNSGGNDGNEENNLLVINSENAKYFKEKDVYILQGDVYITDGINTLCASIARYYRSENILNAIGNVVLFDKEKYVYCSNINFDLNTKKIIFYTDVRGIFTGGKQKL